MDEQKNFSALHEWFLSPQGRDVGMAFADALQAAQLRHRHQLIVQLGHCGENVWLQRLDYSNAWIVNPGNLWCHHTIPSSLTAIPFDRETIDGIIAPLTMELCHREKNPLDEIDRLLKPMGYVAFLGINPWSFWGASLRWGRLSCFAHNSSIFSSSLALKHAMVSRGYRQCWLSSFYYLPPVGSEYWLRKLEFLNQMSKMMWPYPAGFYCLILQKYDSSMTPVRSSLGREMHFGACIQ